MNRNEYRRAFIMLRAAMPGYGGHVRLERRTLTGSMYFIITAPQGVGELSAALVGQRDGAYYAAPIGPLSRDRRGQLALAWTFDPRAIDGRPLEAYAWVAMVATGGPCALALTGNVEGSRPVDARALEAAACALFAPAEAPPAADLPDPAQETRGDVKVYTLTRSRLPRPTDRSAEETPPQPDPSPADPAPGAPADLSPVTQPIAPTDISPESQPAAPAGTPSESQPAAPAVTPSESQLAAPAITPPATQPTNLGAQPAAPAGLSPTAHPSTPADISPEAQPSTPESQPAAPVSAAKRLGLDITAPWPGAAEALRRLFATQAPAADAPSDGFTYVAAPMPAGSGYPYSLAGLKVSDGRIAAIRYALPARRAPEPPAGLESSQWLPGDGESGFWVTEEGG